MTSSCTASAGSGRWSNPITAEAIIGCLDREFDYPDGDVTLQQPHWFISVGA